ncbi:EF-hand domain-containing protein [Sagittula sp. S175]|uniref:EF-hand domain-containing protein n=1 Tax=Sagittula sp. S175 TaxID=3415129 RepID=UPI003C7B1DA7
MKTLSLALVAALLAAPVFAQQGNPGAHFIENWDLNGDGAVSAEEAAERRSDVFASFDSNEDGFLDAGEYVPFDEARANDMAENAGHGQGGGAMAAANGMKLEVNDTDKDGKVSREEFLTNAASWIAGMDKDGDGVVTKADFGRK